MQLPVPQLQGTPAHRQRPGQPVPASEGAARPGEPPRVAVLLNANARGVTPRVVQTVAEVVPGEDLYLSRSLEEAEAIAREVRRQAYPVVLTGGGDGTFMGFLNALARVWRGPWAPGDSTGAARPLPRMGVLRLGTGNALARYAGARGLWRSGVLDDIRTVRAGVAQATRRLDLIEVEGIRAPFLGLGYDALILNNYGAWKRRLSAGPLRFLASGPLGYTFSILGMSLPQAVMTPPTHVRAVNVGPTAYRIGPGGEVDGEVPPGGVLYEGPVNLCAAGTCPYYGYGFKIFPFATARPGFFQLRFSHVPVHQILAHLPAIWRGRYRSPHLVDCWAQAVRLDFDRPAPLQVGGDAAGWRESLELSVSPEPVEIVDFAAARRLLQAAARQRERLTPGLRAPTAGG